MHVNKLGRLQSAVEVEGGPRPSPRVLHLLLLCLLQPVDHVSPGKGWAFRLSAWWQAFQLFTHVPLCSLSWHMEAYLSPPPRS